MSNRNTSMFSCLALLPFLGSYALAQLPAKPTAPHAVFEIIDWPYGPSAAVLSKDGQGLSALSIGLDGRTYYKYWNLTKGKAVSSGLITSDPIPNRGGCIAGDPDSPKHPPISSASWNTLSSPVLDWVHGQAIDLQSKSQSPITNHPGWDAWESYAITPDWSLNSLSVRSLNSSNPVEMRHWVEWNAPSTSISLKRFVAWSQSKRKGFEAISENGKWIAFSSSLEPQADTFEKPGPPKLVECPSILRIWSVGTPLPIHRIPLTRKIEKLEFSPGGSYLIITPTEGAHEIWNTRSGVLIGEFPRQAGKIAWSDDEESFFLFDPSAGKILEIQTATQKTNRLLIFAPPAEKHFSGFILNPSRSQAVGWIIDSDEYDKPFTKLFLFHFPTKSPN